MAMVPATTIDDQFKSKSFKTVCAPIIDAADKEAQKHFDKAEKSKAEYAALDQALQLLKAEHTVISEGIEKLRAEAKKYLGE
jgi:hypothetical protein